MTVQESYSFLKIQLQKLYEDRESANIADLVIDQITGYSKTDRIVQKNIPLSTQQATQLDKITSELLQHRPIQYVLQEAWLAGMKFFVDESVLIPRPETEELIEWILHDIQQNKGVQNILDIGTGSGCIPIILKKKNERLQITSVDISADALKVAAKNAADLYAEINFQQIDFLKEGEWKQFSHFDLIVINPPYIKQSEITSMHKNVVAFEPHLALFVPDNDALIFYKKLANFGRTHLSINGNIFVEINETLSEDVITIFQDNQYIVELRKDIHQKDRMIKATLLPD